MIDRVYIVFCLFILMFCRCADDASFENEQPPKEGILVKLTNGSLASTKTALSSSANLHHVKEVHVFLYQGDTTDMTKAKYVKHENLNWNPMDSADYKVDAVQVKEFLLENSLNLPSGNYTLLCVGLDDRSGETYGLPDALENKPLSEAKATLAKGISIDGIAHSELFAGWETFEYVRGGLSEVEIEMRRRVAGVLCYLKDIPYTLTDNGTYRVTQVRLRLFTNQNHSVSLLRPKEKDALDFGTDRLSDGNILARFDLTGYGRQGDKNLYEIDVKKGEPSRLPNTILMGAYLLPIRNEKTAVDSTLVVDVLGKITNSVNDDPAEGAEEVVLKSFPAVQEEATGDERLQYSIRPNVIYHIGQKSSDDNTDGDYPESLAGTKLSLKVTGWERDTVDVEFPGVPINPTIALVNESGGIYDAEKYIFDCMGTNTIRLRVYPSILKDPWKVTIIDEESNMLFLQESEEVYKKEYKSSVTTKNMIPLVLTDYVKLGGEEIRTVKIRIVSLEDATTGKEKEGTEQILVARQYNAIIVGTGDKARGFSRFNWGTKRSITTGRVTADNSTSDWGYYESPPSQIFGRGFDHSVSDNGYTNYQEAVKGGAADNGFVGSAIQKVSQDRYTYDAASGKIVKKVAGWYLPAKDELNWFLNDQTILDNKERYHIKDAYWSSNVTIAHYSNSRAYIWNAKNNRYEEDGKKRGGNNFYLRPACGMN
ncbi:MULTISPECIES: FimB/Mfa2 family fimbrial subunit [Parabacteroides]|jgi:hypothetical protein|nr:MULTISPECIES: FimB/Mfa2 family fimbrial subunit [Parabacteroides]MDB9028247.1 FimB/Mfa2 family fimbrial subunit [Parabacteroides distasonis]MDB9073758.1 FimB/Mfa2 family fimbrial subunit [Parabacteroides distasonis]RKU59712.1 hypothetical protein DWX33_10050 [Parabacteroides sp. AF19-14]